MTKRAGSAPKAAKPKAPAKKRQRDSSPAERRPHTPKAAGSTPAPASKTKASRVDWDAIEPHYRAGIRSLKDLGSEFGVSDAGIIKHAKTAGWSRNLKAKVQAAADAKVSAALVSAEVSADKALTEKATIEVEATVQARIRIAHRNDIARGRKLAMSLLAELEHQTDNQDLYDQLADLVLPSDEEGTDAAKERARKLREAYNKALSLSGRTDTMKRLAETLRILIDKEREAFGIVPADGSEGAQTPLGEALRDFLGSLHQTGARLPIVPRA